MENDRRILVFDGPGGELQHLALDLIGRAFEVHYANDVDEAQMLASEWKGRINAVLFSADASQAPVPDLARRFGVSPAALIPTGTRPADRVVAALLHHGVRWHLWGEPSDEAIRFVISSVLFEQDPLEIRFDRRVPTLVPAALAIGDEKSDTTIRDIGLGGVCLMGGVVGQEGDEGRLRFVASGVEVELPIRIVWRVGDGEAQSSVAGACFLEVSTEAGEAIDRVIESVFARHRIEKPA